MQANPLIERGFPTRRRDMTFLLRGAADRATVPTIREGEQPMAAASSQIAEILGRARTDAAFRNRLRSQPAAVLAEHGLSLPDGMRLEVHEAAEGEEHLVLPAKPPAELVSEADLAALAAGEPLPAGSAITELPLADLFSRTARDRF